MDNLGIDVPSALAGAAGAGGLGGLWILFQMLGSALKLRRDRATLAAQERAAVADEKTKMITADAAVAEAKRVGMLELATLLSQMAHQLGFVRSELERVETDLTLEQTRNHARMSAVLRFVAAITALLPRMGLAVRREVQAALEELQAALRAADEAQRP